MRNLEATPPLESKEKSPLRIVNLEESLLENKRNFVVDPHHSKKSEDKKRAEILLGDISLLSSAQEEVFHKEKDTVKELDAIHLRSLYLQTEKVKRIATNVTDFVPVVGSIKMIMEGWKGEQYGTEKEIKGVGRVIHTVSGVVFLALDLTGIGAIASELGKGVIKIGERVALRTLKETLAREVIGKEVTKLALRGSTRIDKKEKIVINT